MDDYEGQKDKKGRTPPVKPNRRRITIDDFTSECLAGILSGNPRGVLLAKDELTSWLAAMNQYRGGRGTDRQIFLSIWSGSPIEVDRRSNPDKEPVYARRPFVTVVGNLPPRQIAKLTAGRDDEGDGFVERILFAWPDRVPLPEVDPDNEVRVSQEAERAWDEAVRWLASRDWATDDPGREEGISLPLSEDARRLFFAELNAHVRAMNSGQVPEHLIAVWSKPRANAARLTLILHLLKCAVGKREVQRVDLDSVAGAWRLIRYLKSQLGRVHGEIKAGPAMDRLRRLVAWIERSKKSSLKSADVLAGLSVFREARQVEEALDVLEGMGYVRKRLAGNGPYPKGGRPAGAVYEVNPKLFSPDG